MKTPILAVSTALLFAGTTLFCASNSNNNNNNSSYPHILDPNAFGRNSFLKTGKIAQLKNMCPRKIDSANIDYKLVPGLLTKSLAIKQVNHALIGRLGYQKTNLRLDESKHGFDNTGINSINLSQDEKQAIIHYNNETILIWNMITGKPTHQFSNVKINIHPLNRNPTNIINSFSMDPSGNHLAFVPSNHLNKIHIWDISQTQAKLTHTLESTENILEISWRPIGNYLATRTHKGLYIYSMKDKKTVCSQPIPLSQTSLLQTPMNWSPDGNKIFYESYKERDNSTPNYRRSISEVILSDTEASIKKIADLLSEYNITGLAYFSADNKKIIQGDLEDLAIYDIETRTTKRTESFWHIFTDSQYVRHGSRLTYCGKPRNPNDWYDDEIEPTLKPLHPKYKPLGVIYFLDSNTLKVKSAVFIPELVGNPILFADGALLIDSKNAQLYCSYDHILAMCNSAELAIFNEARKAWENNKVYQLPRPIYDTFFSKVKNKSIRSLIDDKRLFEITNNYSPQDIKEYPALYQVDQKIALEALKKAYKALFPDLLTIKNKIDKNNIYASFANKDKKVDNIIQNNNNNSSSSSSSNNTPKLINSQAQAINNNNKRLLDNNNNNTVNTNRTNSSHHNKRLKITHRDEKNNQTDEGLFNQLMLDPNPNELNQALSE